MLHDCFVRELKPGARLIDAEAVGAGQPTAMRSSARPAWSPSLELFQIEDSFYRLEDLLGDAGLVDANHLD